MRDDESAPPELDPHGASATERLGLDPHGASATERVERAFAQIVAADRPEVWIHLRERADVLEDARAVERRLAAGAELPLAGLTLAVKDNIDVAGLPTTAGCPEYAYVPAADATAVARLKDAGAIVLGKTNMDQFATGLVGTRSPYGAVRDARDPERVAGGSSAGSAVAVALGIADLGLGTDTAGSGRIPAAFQGIAGCKPTRGLVPVRGVVPACRSFDCVSIFATEAGLAETATAVMAGSDREDPLSRGWPVDAPSGAPVRPRIAVAAVEQLGLLSAAGRAALGAVYERLGELGAELEELDVRPILAAGSLLYEGAFAAERYAAVGAFIAAHGDQVDPTVAEIVLGATDITADQYLADVGRLDRLRIIAEQTLRGFDALLLPTAPFQPTIAEVTEAPVERNRTLGTFTNFCNLLDMCAFAVPAGEADGCCFGVTLFAPAFHDRVIGDLARLLDRSVAPGPRIGEPAVTELFVVGAHMTGEPLNSELTDRGGRLVRPVCTAASYRLYRLATAPPKPGLVRVDGGDAGGRAIAGELWALPPAGLASLLAELPSPMALGRVLLEGGGEAVGFLCEPVALGCATEITEYGGWRSYLEAARVG